MKKVFSIIAALAVLVLTVSSCDINANSTNKFKLVRSESSTIASDKITMTVGETVHFYACTEAGDRLYDGEYSYECEKGVLSAIVTQFDGDKAIKVTANEAGTGNVTLRWLWKGFKLFKTITVTVSEASGE